MENSELNNDAKLNAFQVAILTMNSGATCQLASTVAFGYGYRSARR